LYWKSALLYSPHEREPSKMSPKSAEQNLKGAVTRQSSPVCFVFFSYSPLLVIELSVSEELLVNDKITASGQTNMYPGRYI